LPRIGHRTTPYHSGVSPLAETELSGFTHTRQVIILKGVYVMESTKKHKVSAPPNETPEAKFIRIAEPRVHKVLRSLGALSKCTARSYKFSQAQFSELRVAIAEEHKRMIENFERALAGKVEREVGISFKFSK
jgi:hypothetical protein